VSGYIICADNDWQKPKTVAAFERQVAMLERQHRRPVAVARSYIGKDMNDLLLRRAG
jgi:hypothetical protein